jgi:hypothetical protein
MELYVGPPDKATWDYSKPYGSALSIATIK